MSGQTIPLTDVLWHIDRALAGMVATLEDLGDGRVNRRPDLAGANSPYVLVRHCAGVMEYWAGEVIAHRPIERDRDAEFASAGTVSEISAIVTAQRDRLAADLASYDGAARPPGPVRTGFEDREFIETQGGVLMHIYEELAQHRGQLDITADLIRSSS